MFLFLIGTRALTLAAFLVVAFGPRLVTFFFFLVTGSGELGAEEEESTTGFCFVFFVSGLAGFLLEEATGFIASCC